MYDEDADWQEGRMSASIEVAIRAHRIDGAFGWQAYQRESDGRQELLSEGAGIADAWDARAAAVAEAQRLEAVTGMAAYVTDYSHAPVLRLGARQFQRAAERAKARWDANAAGQ